MKKYLNNGDKYGRLTIVGFSHRTERTVFRKDRNCNEKVYTYYYNCLCDCGNTCVTDERSLKNGNTKSCGCLSLENSKAILAKYVNINCHHLSQTTLYEKLSGMKSRCYNPHNKRYKNYGGRGIKVCDEWLDKENGFLRFYNWAMANGYQKGLTIERIDNDGNYCPENCTWITIGQQALNRTTTRLFDYNGQKMSVKQISRITGIKYTTLRARLKRGLSIEEAVK